MLSFGFFVIGINILCCDGMIPTFNMNSAVWKIGTRYIYNLESRTLGCVRDSHVCTGLIFKTRLEFYADNNYNVTGIMKDSKFAYVNQVLPNGTRGPLPNDLIYTPYSEMEYPFLMRMSGGLIEMLELSYEMEWPEENILKGLLGVFQYDAISIYATDLNFALGYEVPYGTFLVHENDVTGKCSTAYRIIPLADSAVSEYIALDSTAKPTDKNPFGLFEITRVKNLAQCFKGHVCRVAINKPAMDTLSNFINRLVVTRTVINRDSNIIYSSELSSNITLKLPLPEGPPAKTMVHQIVNAKLISAAEEPKDLVLFKLPKVRRSMSIICNVNKDIIPCNNTEIHGNCTCGEKNNQELPTNSVDDVIGPLAEEHDVNKRALETKTLCPKVRRPCNTFGCFCNELFRQLLVFIL